MRSDFIEDCVQSSIKKGWTGRSGARWGQFMFWFCLILSQIPALFVFSDRGYPLYVHLGFTLSILPIGVMSMRHYVYAIDCNDEYITIESRGKKIKISDIEYFSIGSSPEWGLKMCDFRHGAYVKMKSKFPFVPSYQISCSKETALALKLLKLGVPHKLHPSTPASHYDDTAESRMHLERIKNQEL